MTAKYQMLIGGRWLNGESSERSFPSYNPFNQQVWAEIPQASAGQVLEATRAARAAFNDWRMTSGTQRSRLLHKLADLLDRDASRISKLETTDNGKVIRETSTQMNFSARNYRFFAGFADKLYGSYIPLDSYTMVDFASWEPLGVCALLTAWNSPIQLLSNKLAPALAAGNVVVIKPSEYASATTLEFGKLVEEAGFPPGVINIITGDGRVGSELCSSPDVSKISFTGGSSTGTAVMRAAAERLVPVTLELGGKSANIIFEDADLSKALPGAVAGIFGAAGQTCMAGSRLLVHRKIFTEVLDRMIAAATAIKMGNPLERETEMGPVANERQLSQIISMVDAAAAEGAKIVAGGKRAQGPGLDEGLFVEPTVCTKVNQAMAITRLEVFGPVVGVMPFDDEQEVTELANDSRYGLVAGVWTENVSRAHRMAKALEVGTVWINTYRTSVAQAPAGGRKGSGFGRERGWHGLLEYLQTRNVMIDFGNEARDPFSIRTQ
jgi:(Z)-2-((N-methylformamido)methylene)-5-hydroxybutyrolactone dehydrogenase